MLSGRLLTSVAFEHRWENWHWRTSKFVPSVGWDERKYRQEWVRDTKDSFRRKEQGMRQDVGRAEIRCGDRRVMEKRAMIQILRAKAWRYS